MRENVRIGELEADLDEAIELAKSRLLRVKELEVQARFDAVRIAELGAENASLREELSALRGEAQERENAAVQQGLAALTDLRAEHAKQDEAVLAELCTVQDNLSQLQQAARSML